MLAAPKGAVLCGEIFMISPTNEQDAKSNLPPPAIRVKADKLAREIALTYQ